MKGIKQDLLEKINNTEDEEILKHLKAILDSYQFEDDWFDSLPEEVKKSVERGLAQAKLGQGTPHSEMRKKYAKWLGM